MNNISYKKINDLSNEYLEDVISLRRDFHMYPELGFEEVRTSKKIAKILEELGYEVKEEIATTGVVGILNPEMNNITIGARADMDALPILENNDLDFKSKYDGKMHACGHDVHTANLLGVAMVLAELKNEINGRVVLVFQPSEEVNAGALEMIKEGVLDNPKIDLMYGMHVIPTPIGEITCGIDEQTSYTDYFDIQVMGRKSHTARPQEGIDAIMIASQIVVSLQSLITRYTSPKDDITFSLGTINGGDAINVVPDNVEISGMIRSTKKDTRDNIKNRLISICEKTAEGFGGKASVNIRPGYPAVINDSELVEIFKKTGNNLFDSINDDLDIPGTIDNLESTFLAGEDFGYYSELISTCYFHVGAGGFKPQHSPEFIIDENVFNYSIPLMSSVIIDTVNKYSKEELE